MKQKNYHVAKRDLTPDPKIAHRHIAKPRKCLCGCNTEFESKHTGNRINPECREPERYH